MRRLLLLVGAVLLLAMLQGTVRRGLAVSRFHSELIEKRIYAYRDWQSTGVRVNQGDMVEIAASGEWLYTPEEYHGPEGHAVFVAPGFYPVAGAAGGALLGRIGEAGQLFNVGADATFQAWEHGILYLRINDDILSDNDGWVAAQVDVTQTADTLP